jgi:hypothetical protein
MDLDNSTEASELVLRAGLAVSGPQVRKHPGAYTPSDT